MPIKTKQVVLLKYPQGAPKSSDFEIVERDLPDLQEGEVLLKTLYFSVDPYMRGRMTRLKSYIDPFEIGELLTGGAVCTVEQSNAPDLKVGDTVLSFTGWQSHIVMKPQLTKDLSSGPNTLTKVSSDVKPSLFLGALGLPGLTAHYGLNKIGEPKKGETVVVSAATGAVGSIVGQLAKLKGCTVVGIAGGEQKCNYAVEQLGLDACLDHKSKTFSQDLEKACPKGIDVYFENVGGHVFFAVFPLLNEFARVPVCGTISWYNDGAALMMPGFSPSLILTKFKALLHFLRIDRTPLILRGMIARRLKFQGLLGRDHFDEYEAFLKELVPLVESGKIIAKEDIIKGIEQAPAVFAGLFEGKNFGKAIIEL